MVDRLFPDDEKKPDTRETDRRGAMDQGVSPLFSTESVGPATAPAIAVTALDMPAGSAQPPSPVSPLAFTGETAPQRPAGPAGPSVAFEESDDPAVTPAMRHAAETFPELCVSHERLLRSRFREILPFTFDAIAQYGRCDLDRNTTLMGRVTTETQQWSALSLAESIQAIIDAARPAHGVFGKMLHGSPDAAEIHRRLGGLSQASEALGQRIDALLDEQGALAEAFKVHMGVLAVCLAMPSRFAEVIQRRAALFAQADQERRLAATQLETLRKGVREGILRLDEVRNVTMPAMGFLQGAG